MSQTMPTALGDTGAEVSAGVGGGGSLWYDRGLDGGSAGFDVQEEGSRGDSSARLRPWSKAR